MLRKCQATAPESAPLPFTRKRDVPAAWLLWLGFYIGICIYQVTTDHRRTVTGAFHHGSANWIEGTDMYGEGLHGFLYLPHAAITYTPFHVLPKTPGELLWRAFCIGIFAVGVRQLSLAAGRASRTELFPIMTLLTIPLAMSAMRNGQMTLPMAGTMMLGIGALAQDRHWWAVFWLCIAVALKPLAVVLLLLAWVLRPGLWWRMPIGIVVLLCVPWLFQNPSYVAEAYQGFLQKSLTSSNPEGSMSYSDFFGMLRAWGVEVPTNISLLVRMVFALLTLGLAFCTFRRHGSVYGITLLFVLAVTYLMLFNPRTENNTYAAFAPALAAIGAWAFLVGIRPILGSGLVLILLLMSVNYELIKHVTPGREVWLPPLLTVVFSIYLTWALLIGPPPWKRQEKLD